MAYRETAKHRVAFEAWYEAERDFSKALETIQQKPDYKAPTTVDTLYNWCKLYNWHDRADARDNEAERKAAKEAIARKAKMLKRHADAGRALQTEGLKYIRDKGVETGQQAISAITKGIEVERTSEGLPAWIVDLLAASDDDLIQQYRNVLEEIGSNRSGVEPPGDNTAE